MQVKTTVETPEGNVEFSAVLTQQETTFLLEYAINSLMREGAIPFTIKETKDIATIQPASEDVH